MHLIIEFNTHVQIYFIDFNLKNMNKIKKIKTLFIKISL
jgi:hypothetical protein